MLPDDSVEGGGVVTTSPYPEEIMGLSNPTQDTDKPSELIKKEFKQTAKQEEAHALITGPARHVLLEGGGRSAKTFECCYVIALRALACPGSRHLIVRFRYNHVMTSIWFDTFPKMMSIAFPGVKYATHLSKSYITMPGGGEIWFGGLDEPENILGREYATIFVNECSQVPYSSIEMIRTRLAQKVEYKVGGETRVLRLKFLYDQNPAMKSHWTYKLFHKGLNPENDKPVENPQNYAHILMNPTDNLDNIAPEYIEEISGAAERVQRRFLRGEYTDENPNALFSEIAIDKWRVDDGKLPEMLRIVVAVDPSGADDDELKNNDAIGIIVAGLGTDGNAYVLEDLTVKAGPATWGRVVCDAYRRHPADVIVGEKNFGGEMVRYVIQTSAAAMKMMHPNFKFVSASRGKTVRAEPVAPLYDTGKIRHAGGNLRDLENELLGYSTYGYVGEKSPNRADALIWAIAELFPGLVADNTVRPSNAFAGQFNSSQGFGP